MEEGGERWSKPHVSTLSLHSLFELRTCLQTGSILLDLEGYSLPQIVGELILCVCVCVSRQLDHFVNTTFILSILSKPIHVLVLLKHYNWVSFSCSDEIVHRHVQDGLIDSELKDKISFILLRKHRHQTKKPIHRSLADIGKPSPTSKGLVLYFVYELLLFSLCGCCGCDVGPLKKPVEPMISLFRWHPCLAK